MAATARNLYDVLGVSMTADRDQIRTAFRRLAREHHPDLSPVPEADERFREVLAAYRTLSRPTTRRIYDMFGHHGLSSDAVEELARWLTVRRRPAEPEVVGEVVLDFSEAARGGSFGVEVETTWTCAGCAGGGAELGSAIERCESCGGSGRLRALDEPRRRPPAPDRGLPRMRRVGPPPAQALPAVQRRGPRVRAPAGRGSGSGRNGRRRHDPGRAGRPRGRCGGRRPLASGHPADSLLGDGDARRGARFPGLLNLSLDVVRRSGEPSLLCRAPPKGGQRLRWR